MSNYRNFWNNERWNPYEKYSKHHYLFRMQNIFQNSAKASSIFEKASTPYWKMFLSLNQLFYAKILIKRLPSFSVPKITVIRHMLPRIKLQ